MNETRPIKRVFTKHTNTKSTMTKSIRTKSMMTNSTRTESIRSVSLSILIGGAGASFAVDGLVSPDDTQLWMPETGGNEEWIQVDLSHMETIIEAIHLFI